MCAVAIYGDGLDRKSMKADRGHETLPVLLGRSVYRSIGVSASIHEQKHALSFIQIRAWRKLGNI